MGVWWRMHSDGLGGELICIYEWWIKLPLIGLLRLRVKVGDSWEWNVSDILGAMR